MDPQILAMNAAAGTALVRVPTRLIRAGCYSDEPSVSSASRPNQSLSQIHHWRWQRRGRDSNPRSRLLPTRRFSKPVPSANSATSPGCTSPRRVIMHDIRRTTPCLDYSVINSLAEEEGFEPPELSLGGFQDRCLRPLGHSSGVPGGKTRGSIERCVAL